MGDYLNLQNEMRLQMHKNNQIIKHQVGCLYNECMLTAVGEVRKIAFPSEERPCDSILLITAATKMYSTISH